MIRKLSIILSHTFDIYHKYNKAELSHDKTRVYEMMIDNKVGISVLQVYENFIK